MKQVGIADHITNLLGESGVPRASLRTLAEAWRRCFRVISDSLLLHRLASADRAALLACRLHRVLGVRGIPRRRPVDELAHREGFA